MFAPLTREEMLVLGRGVIILVIVVVLGVAAAEHQLNSLTRQHEFVKVFNLIRDKTGACSAYVFGKSVTIDALYEIGRIQNIERTVVIETPKLKLVLPTMITLEAETAFSWINVWHHQFVAEAHKTKQDFAIYAKELYPVLAVLKAQVAEVFNSARDIIAGGQKSR